jgi:rhodanese-related sulfurtransferase
MKPIQWIVIFSLLAASYWLEGCSQKKITTESVPRISYNQLTNIQASGKPSILLDIRRDDEVAKGMIPGAIHIPLAELRQRIHEIPRDAIVVVYCASGKRVPKAVPTLKAAGITNIRNFVSVTNWHGSLAQPR